MNKSLTLLCALFAVPCFSADYKMPEFGLDVSNTDDEWIVTASGYLQATEEWNISAEVDSTGYLELGTGYGVMLGQFYTEAFVSYGRADLFDVYDAGVFTGTALGDDWMVFANSSHEWRTSSIGKSFPLLEKTEREWKTPLVQAIHRLILSGLVIRITTIKTHRRRSSNQSRSTYYFKTKMGRALCEVHIW